MLTAAGAIGITLPTLRRGIAALRNAAPGERGVPTMRVRRKAVTAAFGRGNTASATAVRQDRSAEMSESRDGSESPASPADSANPNSPGSSRPTTVGDPITVVLVAKAAADLQITQERSHLSTTDIVNRALSLYEFVDAELKGGAELIVRRDGQDYLVELI
jgi:hypothetical protein